MNLRQLQYIVAIGDMGTITHAAEKLFVSRPALNHFLKSLEEDLGVPLFKRVNRKMIPTYAGNIYIEGAREILKIKTQTYKALQDTIDSQKGVLNLGITYGNSSVMFCKLFPIFHKKFPGFTVNLLEDNAHNLKNAVLKGQIDMAIIGHSSVLSSLEYIILQETELFLVLPKDHPLANQYSSILDKPIDLNLLRDDNFILRTNDTKTREITDRYLEQQGFSPKIIMECRKSSLVYNMVKAGVGVAFLNENEMANDNELPRFSLSPKEIWYQGIAYRRGTHFTKAEEYFIDLFKQYSKEVVKVTKPNETGDPCFEKDNRQNFQMN